jgi:hypothetical protein
MNETTQLIPITNLRLDKTQSRARTYFETVDEYAEAMKEGAEFEPIVVFLVDGEEFHVVDGIHRCIAADKVGIEKLACIVHTGTLRDAIRYSLAANVKHGLRRTNEDKRHAVLMVLADEEWKNLSDRVIADMCGVSNTFVGIVRASQVSTVDTLTPSVPEKRVGSDGKSYPASRQPQTQTDADDDEPADIQTAELDDPADDADDFNPDELEGQAPSNTPSLAIAKTPKSGTEIVSTSLRMDTLNLCIKLYKKLALLGLVTTVKGKGNVEVELAMETIEAAIKAVGDEDDVPTATPMEDAA